MGLLVILRGSAGVGKTTISDVLDKEGFCKTFHLSEFFIKYGLGWKPKQKEIPLENLIKVNKLISPEILKELKLGKIVVVEGNFYNQYQIEDLIERVDSPVKIITLKASLGECIKRDASRSKEKRMSEERIKEVYKLTSKFNGGISINTESKTIQEIVKLIKSNFD